MKIGITTPGHTLRYLHADDICGGLLLGEYDGTLSVCLFVSRSGHRQSVIRHAKRLGAVKTEAAASELLREAERQIRGYMAGEITTFDLPLAAAGTDFQRAVWEGIAAIGYGTTASYGELSGHIGRSDAVRAVAQACGANPLCIVVPCHRVVNAGYCRGLRGGIGGFSAPLCIKKRLLALESHIKKTMCGSKENAPAQEK